MKNKRKQARSKGFLLPCCVIILASVCFIYTDYCLRPSVITVAQYKTQGLISAAVNNAIIGVMGETDVGYESIVQLKKNNSGEITSVNYNSVYINRVRSRLVQAVMEETQRIPSTNIYIPIGNITHIDILHNKGPGLKFTITPSSYVEADVESVFSNTGINQINHRIYINIKVTANALIPNYSTSIYSENKVCIAETVIVGKVPQSIGNGIIYSDD